ncbi:Butyrophilin subfamily 1 member A1 [Varanus komodoensis]|nr:Butyrophilin subfamily 1 member A1 [Varanus komodoensis]
MALRNKLRSSNVLAGYFALFLPRASCLGSGEAWRKEDIQSTLLLPWSPFTLQLPLFSSLHPAVSVNPEPDVAYPWCILSSRLESVTRVWKIRDLPRNPERCDCTPFVLGSKAFTSGRHWWEVNTGAWGTLDWAVGVARDSLRKKPYVRLNPKEGVWAVGSIFNASASVCQLSALTFPKPSPLRVKKQPREIRVCLDYEAGLVEFFSADNNELIFMFHVESFSGEKIRPFFWNRKSSSTGIGQEVKM